MTCMMAAVMLLSFDRYNNIMENAAKKLAMYVIFYSST